MSIEIRSASGRFRTEAAGRSTRHSFSFDQHYAADNVGFGLLVAHNDERLAAGAGYPDHPHRELEIVSVVLSGALRHTSSVGSGVIGPGQVQRLSAGSGVVHAEVADGPEPTRFVQTWLRPSESGGPPDYASTAYDLAGGLVPLVGGAGPIRIGADATLLLGTLEAGCPLSLPDAARLHLFVVSGTIAVGNDLLTADDTARLSDEGGRSLTAQSPASLLVWAM